MKKLRWGIAGPGNIAKKFATACKNLPDCELVAVAARSRERGEAFANTFGIPTVFSSYEEMAASPLVDCVYVATPHPLHKPVAEIFLNAKKHVLCEKPISVNAASARAMRDCAKENGVFLMEAMWTRFLPAVERALEIAASGRIGEVRGLSADFCYRMAPNEDSKVFRNDMAGGAILDVGVYPLHLAAMLFGTETERITADAHIEYGVDCHTEVILRYPGGAMAATSSATLLHKPEDAYIFGTKGYILLPHFYGASELYVRVGGDEEHIVLPPIGAGFEEEILEVVRCVRAGMTESDRHPMERTIAVLAQMDEARRQIGLCFPFPGEDF